MRALWAIWRMLAARFGHEIAASPEALRAEWSRWASLQGACPICRRGLAGHEATEVASFSAGSAADREAVEAVEREGWDVVVGHFEGDMRKDLHLFRAIRCPEGGVVRYSMISFYEPWADDVDEAPVVLSVDSAGRLEASLARGGGQWTVVGGAPAA
jgi:hypothetical protein